MTSWRQCAQSLLQKTCLHLKTGNQNSAKLHSFGHTTGAIGFHGADALTLQPCNNRPIATKVNFSHRPSTIWGWEAVGKHNLRQGRGGGRGAGLKGQGWTHH